MAQYPWFRLYSEFSTDPKVQSMPEQMQRRLIMLFCLRCCNGDATLRQRDELLLQQELCCALRISPTELDETKELFIKKNFINESWDLIKWEKRQFQSDHSTPRSQKSRANKRHDSKDDNPFKEPPKQLQTGSSCSNGDATLQQLPSNGTATPPDTDTDTDTEVQVLEKTTGIVATGNGKPAYVRWQYLSDPEFAPFVVIALEYWKGLTDEDLQNSWTFAWRKFDFQQKIDVVTRLKARVAAGEPSHFVSRPPKYLDSGDWKRPPREQPPRNGPVRETRDQRIHRELMED